MHATVLPGPALFLLRTKCAADPLAVHAHPELSRCVLGKPVPTAHPQAVLAALDVLELEGGILDGATGAVRQQVGGAHEPDVLRIQCPAPVALEVSRIGPEKTRDLLLDVPGLFAKGKAMVVYIAEVIVRREVKRPATSRGQRKCHCSSLHKFTPIHGSCLLSSSCRRNSFARIATWLSACRASFSTSCRTVGNSAARCFSSSRAPSRSE